MDTYIHRGKLKGNTPLTGKDPAIYSQSRSYRISDLPSFVVDAAKARYLALEDATESTLAFPIYWEEAHSSAKLTLELIKKSDGASQIVIL